MNNSSIRVELSEEPTPVDIQPKLRSEEARLVNIIEAVGRLKGSKEWSTLKTEVFDNLVNVLEKDISAEAKKDDPNPLKLNRLSGELKWAARYADLQKMEDTYRVQLTGIRKQLYGKETE